MTERMNDVIDNAKEVHIWIPDADNEVTEGYYHAVTKSWAKRLYGDSYTASIAYDVSRDNILYIH